MAGYLLDTNIISAMVRNPHGPLAQRVTRAGRGNVSTSVIVAAELEYGLLKRQSARLAGSVRAILGSLTVHPLEAPIIAHYARLRTSLERRGETISSNDMLIAAQALALDAVLVTDNEREFARVPDLRFENWLR